jgi:hypothetical protein
METVLKPALEHVEITVDGPGGRYTVPSVELRCEDFPAHFLQMTECSLFGVIGKPVLSLQDFGNSAKVIEPRTAERKMRVVFWNATLCPPKVVGAAGSGGIKPRWPA